MGEIRKKLLPLVSPDRNNDFKALLRLPAPSGGVALVVQAREVLDTNIRGARQRAQHLRLGLPSLKVTRHA